MPGVLKVSVIIPTYASPRERLDGLVRSLDRQTMPREDFEVFFIDDGSPDDTWERLQEIQSTRANVRIERIENSGWPSKPRNIGIENGRGEYVVFLDHDDQLYPEALEAAYAYAEENGADVVNGKEVRTNKPHWGLNAFDRDLPQAVGRTDRHPLTPMNPHKLYRRAFLVENHIRFPEGGRVLWEDQFFNLQVAHHARVISLLSTVPFYHWVTTEGSGSTGFLRKEPAYWRFLREICQTTQDELAGDDRADERELLMVHQYSTRVLGSFTKKFVRRAAPDRKYIFDEARELQSEFDLSALDDRLMASRRIRAHLLRTGQQKLLETVCAQDTAPVVRGRAQSLHWDAGVLKLRAVADWGGAGGSRYAMVRDGERILKRLPAEVNAAVPVEARDVTDEITAATLRMLVHSRRSQVAWMLDSSATIDLDEGEDGAVVMSGIVVASLDPRTAAMGRPLESGATYDIGLHSEVGGAPTHRRLAADLPATMSLEGDRLCLAFSNAKGTVSLIVDDTSEAVRRLTPVGAAVDAEGNLVVSLSGVHDGVGEIETRVAVRAASEAHPSDQRAALRVRSGRAELTTALSEGETRIRIGDRVRGNPGDWVVAVRGGQVTLGRGAENEPKPPARKPDLKPKNDTQQRVRRWSGRVLRRLGLRR